MKLKDLRNVVVPVYMDNKVAGSLNLDSEVVKTLNRLVFDKNLVEGKNAYLLVAVHQTENSKRNKDPEYKLQHIEIRTGDEAQ
jgi:hypothetical protein